MHVACGHGTRKGNLGLNVLAVARRVVEGSRKGQRRRPAPMINGERWLRAAD